MKSELRNKQRVIDDMLLLLSQITNRDDIKTPLQDDSNLKYAENVSVSTQTCETINNTIETTIEMNKPIIAPHESPSNTVTQLDLVRKFHQSKYHDFKVQNRLSLKRRLQQLADYSYGQIEPMPSSNLQQLSQQLSLSQGFKSTQLDSDSESESDSDSEVHMEHLSTNTESVAEITTQEQQSDSAVCIMGDSILKHVTPWKVKNKLSQNRRVIVKSFPGAKSKQMKHFMHETLRNEHLDHVIVHAGTNDLQLDESPHKIANSIVNNLMSSIENYDTILSISAITCRDDELRHKARQVNNILRVSCKERNIGFIEHDNIQPKHLNGSKLHLNKLGTKNIIRNFVSHLEKY